MFPHAPVSISRCLPKRFEQYYQESTLKRNFENHNQNMDESITVTVIMCAHVICCLH